MSLEDTPDEVIQQVLLLLPPEDILKSISLLSRRLNRLASEPLLWRYHCKTSFKHWSPEHDIEGKLNQQKASDVDWKGLYLLRAARNAKAARLLNEIIDSKVGRLEKYEEIARFDYDVKEFLVTQCHTHSTEDVLARRYYANVVLGSIHRHVAIRTWQTVQGEINRNHGSYSNRHLEKAVAAFDMFVLYDQEGDITEISAMLDALSRDFRRAMPNYSRLTTRMKALTLNCWIRQNNLTGLTDPSVQFRNLRNCFLGQALRHPEHESLPLISSVIFCCLAERLGLRCECCAFPTRVHVVVYSDQDRSLDGAVLLPPGGIERMYLDPFSSSAEVQREDSPIGQMMSSLGLDVNSSIQPAIPPMSITMRNARNIRATSSRAFQPSNPDISRLLVGNDLVNMNAALYGAAWANVILSMNMYEWHDHLGPFLRHFCRNWREDAWLIKKYICPKFVENRNRPRPEELPQRQNVGAWDNPFEILRILQNLEAKPIQVFRRPEPGSKEEHAIQYRIGQVFRHRRYGWFGVINGWADPATRLLPQPHTEISMDETGLDSTQVSVIPPVAQTRNQTFYTCLRTSNINRYVIAEQNIEIFNDAAGVPREIFQLAGKYFRRFDEASCTFVSNIREQYPED